jgi:ElaB/YqjD/DUF883 family membrane-anchored ribosome-binding protein
MAESLIPEPGVGPDGKGQQSPVSRYMQDAVHAFDGVKNYFQTHDSSQMKHDFETRVRKNPLAAVAVSVGVGYLLGKILR